MCLLTDKIKPVLNQVMIYFTFGSPTMSVCPCISFRDIPGQGIEMHALTAS